MQTRPIVSPDAAERRRRAEERLRGHPPETNQTQTVADRERLVHELQVHQIELEMQNEELQATRAKLELLLAQYADLYDFAPMGCFSLAADGTIIEVNLTGASLVGIERARLLDRRFTSLVSEADQPGFKAFLEKVFAGEGRPFCEVSLPGATTAPLFVRIEAVTWRDQQECRAVVLDVTDRHRAEAERERLIQELQTALARVKQLSGLIPICAGCKRIRDDKGYWEQVESCLQHHSEATFTHSLCPDCIKRCYPELDDAFPESTTPGAPAGEMPGTDTTKNAAP